MNIALSYSANAFRYLELRRRGSRVTDRRTDRTAFGNSASNSDGRALKTSYAYATVALRSAFFFFFSLDRQLRQLEPRISS